MVVLAVAVATILPTAACSDDSAVSLREGAPGYCQQLIKLPDGLTNAVTNAVSGTATNDDKTIIMQAAAQLRGAAGDASVPADTKTMLSNGASALDKVASSTQLSDDEANGFGSTFESLGKVVDNTCAAK